MHFVALSQNRLHSTLSISLRLHEGKTRGFFSAQDELMWLANYFCTFCRAARIKVIAENELTGPQ